MYESLSKFFGKVIDVSKTNGNRLAKYAEQVRLGLHSESDTGPLSKRKNALESEYFHQKNKENLEKLKAKKDIQTPPPTAAAAPKDKPPSADQK